MTVEESRIVDAVGVDRASGEVVLSIADHSDWGEEESHLLALQEKLNSYLAFAESGELLEQYPDARDRSVRFDIFLRHFPTERGEEFLREAQAVVASAGFALTFRVLNAIE